jgi:predicted phage-related endonuclease
MIVERRPIIDREQWLAWRRQDVTASAVAALFGAHPYLSALKLYLEKCGIEFPENDNAVFRRGRRMEPGVAIAVAEERPEWTIRPAREYLRAPELRLGASPDFYIDGDPRGLGVLQAKSAAPSVYDREWGDGPPFWITLQTLAECILSDAAFGVAAALRVDAYDMDCAIHEIPRHRGAETRILAAVAQFWDDIEHGREPDPDYGKDAELIKIIAPREAALDKAIDLSGNNELPELLAERALLMARQRQDDARCKEIETEIKFLMRDAAIVSGLPEWRITWKTEPRKGYTVAPSEPRVLRIYDKRIEESP